MVGNAHDAARALAGILPVIGEGCTREVYISEDTSTVYKVNHYRDVDSHDSNALEYSLRNLDVPAPFKIPPMTLYRNGVLAMPYYGGTLLGECWGDGECCKDKVCLSDTDRDNLARISLDLTTWGNTCQMEDGIYLIDLA